MASVWGELKRRNVVRVAIAYAVVSWLVLQLTDVLMPILDLPEWADRLVFLLLVIGFLLALVLSWAYELTPDGITLEKNVDRSQSITPTTGRKLDFVIIAILAIALGFFALDKFVWNDNVEPAELIAGGSRTIAVLPFLNMSADPEQEFFSDGLTEELLNLLAKVPDLRVTSRTSSFAFKGREVGIDEIARELDVEHILEGSVRRSGDTLRITAQLIDVSSDSHIWSETWDRTFNDVFVIQDEIAAAVVDALKVNLLGESPRAQETTAEAYALYLRSVTLIYQRTSNSLRQSEVLLRRVVEIDPDYLPAWEALGRTYFYAGALSPWPPVEIAEFMRDVATEILRLDAHNARAHAFLSIVAGAYDYDVEAGRRELELALELAPHDADVLLAAGLFEMRLGRGEEAIEFVEEAEQLDPLHPFIRLAHGSSSLAAGRLEKAATKYRDAIALSPDGEQPNAHYLLGNLLYEIGDFDGALAEYNLEVRQGLRLTGRALIYRLFEDTERGEEALTELHTLSDVFTYELAKVYADRGDADEAFFWLERAYDRRDTGLALILFDQHMDNIRGDPRFDVFLEQLGRKPF